MSSWKMEANFTLLHSTPIHAPLREVMALILSAQSIDDDDDDDGFIEK